MSIARNKPRVFLSHSKHDIAFIQRAYDDLRHCQIEPWLDFEEIRHGQPWLDAIFESGIPTCDCVLVYLTPTSIESAMVKKEIDASLITKLRDNHISFLPYVSEEILRSKLRSDLQALQTSEWNEKNYGVLLPRVVAEIWRGFLERTIVAVTNDERVKRLEAELELGKIKNAQQGVFAEAEERDLRYIWDAFDREEPVTLSKQIRRDDGTAETLEKITIQIRTRSIIPFLAGPNNFEHSDDSVIRALRDEIKSVLPFITTLTDKEGINITACPELSRELLMFGLIERRERPQPPNTQTIAPFLYSSGSVLYTRVYTQKIERLKYWLALKGELPKTIEWRAEQTPQD